MRTKIIFKMLAFLFVVGLISCQSKNQEAEAKIKVIFTNQQTLNDLDKIKEEQKLKDVSIIYNTTTFDSIGKINFIDFSVSYKGLNGNANASINDSTTVGFVIDTDKNEIQVGPMQK